MTSSDTAPAKDPSPYAGMDNTQLAVARTELAGNRTGMAETRTNLAEKRTGLSIERTDLAETRTELARERTRAAEERTLMAWIRTSLSMISFGFGIDRFFKYLQDTDAPHQMTQISEERLLGLSLMTLGVAALAGALVNHWNVLRRLKDRNYEYATNSTFGFTIGVVLLFIGIAAFVPLLVGEVQLGEIFTVNSQLIQTLAGLVIFVLMLSLGINVTLERLLTPFQQPKLLVRALLAVLVIFPLIVVGVLLKFDVSPRIFVTLVLLASAPAAPLLTKRVGMAQGDMSISAGLQVFLALLSVIVTPVMLLLFSAPFPQATEKIEFLSVAQQIATVQLLPLGLGLLIRRLVADLAEEVASLMVTIANTLFIVLACFLVAISVNLVPQFSIKSLIAFAVVAASGLVVGHLLGGPNLGGRASVAIATIARNAGLALFIAIANNQPSLVPPIVTYLIVGAVVALPYNVWVKLQFKKQLAAEASEPASAIAA
ncbi:MAG: DUF202 domain-containing protein [Cyanobacteria bacterium P01_H01_bin.15]